MKIYKLKFITENPSANETYMFSTKELAEKKANKLKKMVKEDIKISKETEEIPYFVNDIKDLELEITEITLDDENI